MTAPDRVRKLLESDFIAPATIDVEAYTGPSGAVTFIARLSLPVLRVAAARPLTRSSEADDRAVAKRIRRLMVAELRKVLPLGGGR